jgi:hypothetical protein
LPVTVLVLLVRSSRPADAVLGRIEGRQGFHDIANHEGATPVPDLVMYRFAASIIFFNASHFRRRVIAAADANPTPKLERLGPDALLRTPAVCRGAVRIAAQGRRRSTGTHVQVIEPASNMSHRPTDRAPQRIAAQSRIARRLSARCVS